MTGVVFQSISQLSKPTIWEKQKKSIDEQITIIEKIQHMNYAKSMR